MYNNKNIKKETRAKGVFHRSKIMGFIRSFIYEQTGCEKCRRGEFCSRDGKMWGCSTYGSIVGYLNTKGDGIDGAENKEYRTSRGGKWTTKTVRDQMIKGQKVVSKEDHQLWIKEQNQLREKSVVWEIPTIIEGVSHQEMIDLMETRSTMVTNITSVRDVDFIMEELREMLLSKRADTHNLSVSIIETPNDV